MVSGVREYYDANTRKFLLTGGHRVLHRELWGPGVVNRREALHHAHALVVDEIAEDDQRVLDLGCGVGTAALYVARQRPVDVVGVSISPEQIRLAKRFADSGGPLRGSARFEVGDFTAMREDLSGFDLAFAIESFVHAEPASAFFREVGGALQPGGALVVIDDFMTDDGADRRLDDFRTGWHASSLMTVARAVALAADAGLDLVDSRDLSPLQRLGRPRDRVVLALQPVLRRLRRRSLWAQSMVGGHALQACHRAGLLEYHLLRFQRRAG